MPLYVKKRGEFVEYRPPKLYQECEDCGGNGETECEECAGGVVECEECEGTGYDDEKETIRCAHCNVEDENDLDLKPGELQCSKCKGKVNMKCGPCKAEGYRPATDLSELQQAES